MRVEGGTGRFFLVGSSLTRLPGDSDRGVTLVFGYRLFGWPENDPERPRNGDTRKAISGAAAAAAPRRLSNGSVAAAAT